MLTTLNIQKTPHLQPDVTEAPTLQLNVSSNISYFDANWYMTGQTGTSEGGRSHQLKSKGIENKYVKLNWGSTSFFGFFFFQMCPHIFAPGLYIYS